MQIKERGKGRCPILKELGIDDNNAGTYNSSVIFLCLYCPLQPRCVLGSENKRLVKRAKRIADDIKNRKAAGEDITRDNLWEVWRTGAPLPMYPVLRTP